MNLISPRVARAEPSRGKSASSDQTGTVGFPSVFFIRSPLLAAFLRGVCTPSGGWTLAETTLIKTASNSRRLLRILGTREILSGQAGYPRQEGNRGGKPANSYRKQSQRRDSRHDDRRCGCCRRWHPKYRIYSCLNPRGKRWLSHTPRC